MSLLIRRCMRATLCCVLSSPHVAKQASKLRSIITRGLSSLLHCSVTKFHTNWPHQLRSPETDFHWVRVCLCTVWRDTCITQSAWLLKLKAPMYWYRCELSGNCSVFSIDLLMHTYSNTALRNYVIYSQLAHHVFSQSASAVTCAVCVLVCVCAGAATVVMSMFICMSSFASRCWLLLSPLIDWREQETQECSGLICRTSFL